MLLWLAFRANRQTWHRASLALRPRRRIGRRASSPGVSRFNTSRARRSWAYALDFVYLLYARAPLLPRVIASQPGTSEERSGEPTEEGGQPSSVVGASLRPPRGLPQSPPSRTPDQRAGTDIPRRSERPSQRSEPTELWRLGPKGKVGAYLSGRREHRQGARVRFGRHRPLRFPRRATSPSTGLSEDQGVTLYSQWEQLAFETSEITT